MIPEAAIWAIFLLPLGTFALIGLIIRPLLNRFSLLSGLTLIASLGVALGFSVWTLRSVILGHDLDLETYQWLEIGSAKIQLGLLIDQLTAIMLVVVTGVSLLVQIYSLGYMKGDPGFSRYFAYMALFTAAMLGVVMSTNIIQLYAFWELVGVSSYLLIGFWHERPAAAAAAKKAFIITRIGDVGFLIAILYLFVRADDFAAAGLNAFHIPDIWQAAQPVAIGGVGILGGAALTWFTLGIFSGAAGKSGQFPLHPWLPDAMEGPTPVSALIHAATMVAAGVFLVARFYPVIQQSGDTMSIIALIGAFTAVMAATMGLVMNDIKRVMAYSTVSQLGYMMAALGVGAYSAAMFHLFTHASFKALLFLGAGSVNHATGTFDMRYMGGLVRHMKVTYVLMVIGGLSLMGIIPLAGFWSKDEILAGSWYSSGLVDGWVNRATFIMLLIGIVLTAFYTFRMLHMTFHGEFRGGIDQELADQAEDEREELEEQGEQGSGMAPADAAPVSAHGGVHLAESPVIMLFPMMVLGVAAIISGYLANPQWDEEIGIPRHWISEFLLHGLENTVPVLAGNVEIHGFSRSLATFSTVGAAIGIILAAGLYLGRRQTWERDPLELGGKVHSLLANKYYVDALYEGVVVRSAFYRLMVGAVDWLDRNIVDGVVDTLGWFFRNIGSMIGRVQTGQVQSYGGVVVFGILLIILGFLLS
ncbi:MAG: NADH-quinone oxidoreductase subunit L [SAR202 cluster bacterium Io17-Chloro-G4]|nr:MAG: NADH-quinone oxidoreductase subunit L [SAR202 cluster bacterium Io17-Chloro-G4]